MILILLLETFTLMPSATEKSLQSFRLPRALTP